MGRKNTAGHLAAIITVLIWGVTYISTKVLLREFQPMEILFFRFLSGFVALFLVYPHRLELVDKKQELLFIMAGLCGVCLYPLLENTALTYTLASNVGVIIAAAPFFTAILTCLLMKQEERLHIQFFAGFLVSMVGISLINFNGSRMELNPAGDLLAIAATIAWGFYSVLTRKISAFGYNTIQVTRRIFGYGLLFILPVLFFGNYEWNPARLARPVNLLNILFLGLGASALCFVTWNFAIKTLGPVKTSVYIYLEPVITVVTAAFVLGENITVLAITGTALTMTGLVLSEVKYNRKENGLPEDDG
ncbi:MAG: DMT family transporter [Acetatifactor muris]|nr:DMT family transporter [Acetatifactor muris]